MKPIVGELVFCTGRYCSIIFVFNVALGGLTVFLNALVFAALLKIAKRNSWKVSNIILCSLVVTDFLTGLICQPLHAYFVYRQRNIYNPEDLEMLDTWLFFTLNYFSYTFSCASLLIATLMAVERLFAVVFSIKHRRVTNVRRTTIFVVIISIISCILPLFRFVSIQTQALFMVLLVVVVGLALGTITVSYIVLYRSFKKQRIVAGQLSTSEGSRLRGIMQQRRLAKTFAILTVVLILMFLPHLLLKPLSIAMNAKKGSAMSDVFVILEDSFNTLLYANAVVNPFIYFVRHYEVHREMRLLISSCFNVSSRKVSEAENIRPQRWITETQL